MATFGYIILCVLGLVFFVWIVWRLSSRRCDLPCPAWLRWFVELDNPFTKTNRAAFIVEHLGLEPGMIVLDAGCGPGRLTIPVARGIGGDGRVVAMDVQDGMLRRVKAKVDAEKLDNVEFLHAGLGEGTLGEDRFDRVLLVTVLGEIPGRKAALEEVFRSLKAGGILSITEVVFDPHFQRHSTVARLAGEIGFRERKVFGKWWAFTAQYEKPACQPQEGE